MYLTLFSRTLLKAINMSKYKHRINQIVCEWLNARKRRPLRILETHQGEGDATEKYRRYGCVISFEIDREIYNRARHRYQSALSLDACLESSIDLLELAENYQRRVGYPIILPSHPMDSRLGIDVLNRYNYRFDVIDVDPFGSPIKFIPRVLDLLDDKSILLVTTGEMHYVRWSPQDAMSAYEIQADQTLKTTRSFFRKDNVLIVGAWIAETGLKKSIGLYPIFIYDYYRGRSGVQRLGFYVRQGINLSQTIEVKQQIINDPILGVKLLKCSLRDKVKENGSVAWRFCDSHSEGQIQKAIIKRLDHLQEG